MRYWAITLGGLALCGASIVAIDWGMWHLMLTGSCASGGPYVSARPCPPGTGAHILALMAGIFGGLIGAGVFTARGRAQDRRDSRYPLPLAMWTLLFCTLAGSALYAVLGPAAGPDAPKGTAIFLGALFFPMGLAPLPFGLRGGRKKASAAELVQHRAMAGPAPAAAKPAAAAVVDGDGDALAKIEKLGDLREKGLITQAEFETQKQKLLGEV